MEYEASNGVMFEYEYEIQDAEFGQPAGIWVTITEAYYIIPPANGIPESTITIDNFCNDEICEQIRQTI